MRIVRVSRFGGPEVLETVVVPDPVAGPGQVVVEVVAADVLFVETQIRQGQWEGYFDVPLPYVPGSAVAGRVVSVGAGVDAALIGQEVAAHVVGGYASQVVVPVAALFPLSGVDVRSAAALITDGITASALAEKVGFRAGERVLILGAAGGMGVLLVQLAHAAGAHVIAAARGARKLELLRSLGADEVVDYSAPDWVRSADVVLDGVGGELGLEAFSAMADGGRFSAHGAPSGGFAAVDPVEAKRRDIALFGIADLRRDDLDGRRLAARALAEAAAGRLKPVIGQTFPLSQAADAHAAIEARNVIGKTLLIA
jgi:NADPH2:quinone reductase